MTSLPIKVLNSLFATVGERRPRRHRRSRSAQKAVEADEGEGDMDGAGGEAKRDEGPQEKVQKRGRFRPARLNQVGHVR